MKLSEMAKAYADAHDVSVTEATKIINNVFGLVYDSLNTVGDHIDIKDTLHIKVVQRAGRTCINPQTKEPMEVAPKLALKVTMGKSLKEKLNS